MRLDTLTALNAERAARRPALVVTDPSDGRQRLVRGTEIDADPLASVLREKLASGRSGLIADADARPLFVAVHAPPVRLVAVGAVHITQALAPMAGQLGLDLTVIDPRTAFATPERFPNVRLVAEWPDAALETLGLDAYTALLALTHDPKIDDPALIAALKAECAYVGALGSRKTHARRVERLRQAGFDEEDIARIHAPIGLDIGAVSPAEIALAILAQVVATLRRARIAARAGA
ncbi:XdhC family protein [Methylorubrum salsuginis]|uniref:Xanthine dehydrogenase accessory factor n=1 Tax=Methylorubrum salsuginis TaxID=414703 RepID=A0A1I4A0Q8_9HYPH|nr:XdhC family protein [Methylorubrum salsuginis]SFK49697.1 xanthine dehydrogenase accessory factor [Methylorubrum salsuginis]